ncbi:hypothetical protein COHA_006231 [Chlorella ohadii]|uniref:Secreted protein n=1 Tax=Chlorella ohadii TaxID=2649997 RepID=A0AAD5DLH4_9CHLO|nr:hypothetical protein COHA_006231 [Chlorella ohadii]
MKKFLAIVLAVLALAQLALAGAPWEANRTVRDCVKHRKCWTKGTTAVCGVDPHSHKHIGFPNRCYFACVNFHAGDTWEIDHWYHPSHKCYTKHWTARCSRC